MQDQVVCYVRYKGLTKEMTLQFTSESMGMNSEDPSSGASSALCYPFALGKSSTLSFSCESENDNIFSHGLL